MTDRIKSSFDTIRASDKLKSDTLWYLQKAISVKKAPRRYARKSAVITKYAAALASAVILFVSGMLTHNLYFTPAAYVDVDVNPSIELTLNSFDRVIGAHAYNNDGDDIIAGLSLTHKSYNNALIILMDALANKGYIQDDGLVSVTLQAEDKQREPALLKDIQSGLESYMTGHHNASQLDVFSVSSDTRNHSHEQGVSPAKYLAIQELIEVDPTASVETCRNHTISEIKQLAKEHGRHHNNASDTSPSATDDADAESSGTTAAPETEPAGGHEVEGTGKHEVEGTGKHEVENAGNHGVKNTEGHESTQIPEPERGGHGKNNTGGKHGKGHG